ncbi:MAG: glycogen-binding domain-containing protein [Elusimicrobiota bacterium]
MNKPEIKRLEIKRLSIKKLVETRFAKFIEISRYNQFLFISIYFYLFLFSAVYAQPLESLIVENGVRFSYQAPDAQTVTLAGEFNQWTPDKIFLTKDEKGIWTVVYPLTEGKYEYKFVIDGNWMEGANLVLRLKKDKEGKLFIPEEKGTIAPYSGKIRFGGKFAGLLYSRYDTANNDWRIDSDSSSIHLDIDWFAKPFDEGACYARMEIESKTRSFNLKFKQGDINFTPKGINLKAYYNEKLIQFDNPLKSLDTAVSVRYEAINFFDELNPHKGYGMDTQGLFQSSEIYGFTETFFYSNLTDTNEDTIGLRLKKPLDKVTFGLTYFLNRGSKWSYTFGSSGVGWFDDPEVIPEGRSYDTTLSTQPWYKGGVNTQNFGFDFIFKFHDKLTFFSEYTKGSQKLVATRWNESKNTDVAIDKEWLIKNTDDALAGFKVLPIENLATEISYQNKNQKLGAKLYSSNKAETNIIKGVTRYSQKPFLFGIELAQQSSKKLDSKIYIDGDLHPYFNQIYFYQQQSTVYNLPENDFYVMPFVSFEIDRVKAKLISRMHNSKAWETGGTSGTVFTDPSWKLYSSKIYETILDHSIKIIEPIYFEGSTRFSYIKIPGTKKSYISEFLAVVLKFKNSAYLKLGWGVDPENFDEDIYEDIDRREEFLYNNYLTTGSIFDAEKLLTTEKQISLRTEIKF